MMPSRTGSTPGIFSGTGATIGTTTKMISNAFMTKPSRNSAAMAASVARPTAARQARRRPLHHGVAAETAKDETKDDRAD